MRVTGGLPVNGFPWVISVSCPPFPELASATTSATSETARSPAKMARRFIRTAVYCALGRPNTDRAGPSLLQIHREGCAGRIPAARDERDRRGQRHLAGLVEPASLGAGRGDPELDGCRSRDVPGLALLQSLARDRQDAWIGDVDDHGRRALMAVARDGGDAEEVGGDKDGREVEPDVALLGKGAGGPLGEAAAASDDR